MNKIFEETFEEMLKNTEEKKKNKIPVSTRYGYRIVKTSNPSIRRRRKKK